MRGLVKILESERDERFSKLLAHAKDVSSSIPKRLAYGSEEGNIFLYTHKADADGFGSLIVLKFGLEKIIGFSGSLAEINSLRLMDYNMSEINKFETGKNGLNKIRIFADIPTVPSEAICSETIVLDHHPLKSTSQRGMVLNPHAYGIDGESQLSGSLLSLLTMALMNADVQKHVDGASPNEMRKIDANLDYLMIYALAGAAADQQVTTGANAPFSKYAEEKGFVKKVNVPFYGYYTKPLKKVLAESSIPFNLKYNIPAQRKLRNLFDGYGIKSHSSLDSLISKFGLIFAEDDSGKLGLNKQYISGLSPNSLTDLDNLLRASVSGGSSGEGLTFEKLQSKLSYVFEDYWDDHKLSEKRIEKAAKILSANHLDSEMTLAMLKNPEAVKALFADNIYAFSDPKQRHHFRKLLAQPQYLLRVENSELMKGLSLSELANTMTAISKFEEDPCYMEAIDIELNLGSKAPSLSQMVYFQKIKKIVDDYHFAIFNGMNSIEKQIFTGDALKELSPMIHYLDLNFLSTGRVPLPKMTGVYGGVICSNRMLPGNYGLLFTSCNLSNDLMKISGRLNLGDNNNVNLGSFFKEMVARDIVISGGGHKSAAACVLPKKNFKLFGEAVKDYSFGIQ
jgi:hypothetical protein